MISNLADGKEDEGILGKGADEEEEKDYWLTLVGQNRNIITQGRLRPNENFTVMSNMDYKHEDNDFDMVKQLKINQDGIAIL